MHIALIVLTALAIAGLAYIVLVTPIALRRTTINVPIAGLPPALDGYTIAALSDLHYGGTIAPARLLGRAVHLANEASPDVIVLLGDYALSHSLLHTISRWLYEWALPRMTQSLTRLRAPDGVIAILGNHDYDYNAPNVAAWLQSTGSACARQRMRRHRTRRCTPRHWRCRRLDARRDRSARRMRVTPARRSTHRALAQSGRRAGAFAGRARGPGARRPHARRTARAALARCSRTTLQCVRCLFGEWLGATLPRSALRHDGRRRPASTAHELSGGGPDRATRARVDSRWGDPQHPVCALVHRRFQLPSDCRSSSAYALDS